MAKLKARGRTELVRVAHEEELPTQKNGETSFVMETYCWRRTSFALMSDGQILRKVDYQLRNPGPYDRPYQPGTWAKDTKVKAGVDLADFAKRFTETYEVVGWRVVKSG